MLSIINQALDIIFPISCLICQQGETLICPKCLSSLELSIQELPLENTDRTIVAADYQNKSLQTLIKAFKYRNLPQLAQPLSQLLKSTMCNYSLPAETILLPVPLHQTRLRSREYNQSELLARELSRHFGWQLLPGLKRIRQTKEQAKLSRAERLKNLHQAFGYNGSSLTSKHIIILDDVVTTGATIEAAAAALRPHGPASITALALARNHQLEF